VNVRSSPDLFCFLFPTDIWLMKPIRRAVAPSDYSCPDGPGPLGRHENGLKTPDTSPERHAGCPSTGQPSTGIGPGLGRYLGTVARPDKTPGPTRPTSPRPRSPTVGGGVYKLPPPMP
jgi:hypothetical protein